MAGRRSNGEGSVVYDKRRKKPYRARITLGWEYDDKTGKSKQIIKDLGSFKTKGEATAALAEQLKYPLDLNNKDITFRELYQLWYPDYVKENPSYEYRVKAAYKYCSAIYNKKVKELSVADMKNCINNGTAPCTRGKYKGIERNASAQTKLSIKHLFNYILMYAVEARLIDRNYAKDFNIDKKVTKEVEENRKIKIPFSKEEMDTLWRSIDFVPFADMVIYACYSGWRPTELIRLKVESVNLEEGYVRGGIKSTAGRNRLVPIHPLVKDIVEKRYAEAIAANSSYLFNDVGKKTGIGLSYDQYLSRFNNVMEALNFRKDITPHYTRHTFITKAKSRNVKMDEYVLKMLVGHKIGDLTEHVYTHRELQDLKDEIELIKE